MKTTLSAACAASLLLTASAVSAQCENAVLEGASPAGLGGFGTALALEGGRLFVGHPGQNRVEVFEYVTGAQSEGWAPWMTVLDSSGTAVARFGAGVATDASRLVVGSPNDSVPSIGTGTVDIFRVSGSTISFEQKIYNTSEFNNVGFGDALAIDGTWLAIGAHNSSGGRGKVLIYEKPLVFGQSSWTQRMSISGSVLGEDLGASMAMSGSRLVVGAPGYPLPGSNSGRIYIYDENTAIAGDDWVLDTVLIATNSAGRFGDAVAIEGDTLVVGAPGNGAGSVRVWEKSGAIWSGVQTLTASDGQSGDEFGTSVAIQGNRILVGARGRDAAYVFEKKAGQWVSPETVRLDPANPQANSSLGHAVALDQDWYACGAPDFDSFPVDFGAGAAHVFDIDASFCAHPQEISILSGGEQNMQLDFGPDHGGDIYLVLGSVTGVSPGLVLDGLTLPLNYDGPDKYFDHTLIFANSATHQSTFGVLGPHGKATPRLAMPGGQLPLSVLNLTFHHAAVVIDPALSYQVTATSNPTVLTFGL